MEFARLTPGPGFGVRQSLMYFTQRTVSDPRLRRAIAAGLASAIRVRQGRFPDKNTLSPDHQASLQSGRKSGNTSLPSFLDAKQVADIHAFLRNKQLITLGPDRGRFAFNDLPAGVKLADYSLADIVDCPHILELANDPSLLSFAAQYIGCKPTVSALWLRWSFPGGRKGAGLEAFHRDSDDWRFLKIFFYLTDVDETAGPHVYVRGTHLTKGSMRLRSYSDEDVLQAYGSERVTKVIGSSGFGFAVDTFGIHKGQVPAVRPRLLLQIQYSLLPAYAYRYNPVPYSGPLQLDNYINRLILNGVPSK